MKHPVTPDGRYFLVRGRLWRTANPDLEEGMRSRLVKRLMAAKRAIRNAKADKDPDAEAAAHRAVDEVKRALGERGPVWWTDGAADFNRQMAKNTPYVAWDAKVSSASSVAPQNQAPPGRHSDSTVLRSRRVR
ncbi:hypothetical protein [Bradyrhizobium sp. TM102]|uniref:hypothetical protein n=1 Tax=Bradyrhizobium sp. TM102 TaxID=2599819 RepID=UPI0012A3149C|nr:hypothetical protein [Bradyrhizobium sp. TM102]BBO14745.1 hypothetical protein TM102_62150 [Bradyrhizobium sp. TM102]